MRFLYRQDYLTTCSTRSKSVKKGTVREAFNLPVEQSLSVQDQPWPCHSELNFLSVFGNIKPSLPPHPQYLSSTTTSSTSPPPILPLPMLVPGAPKAQLIPVSQRWPPVNPGSWVNQSRNFLSWFIRLSALCQALPESLRHILILIRADKH